MESLFLFSVPLPVCSFVLVQGCSKAHAGVILGDYQDPLDPESEAQTVYSQLWNGFDKIRTRYCADRPYPHPVIQEEVIKDVDIVIPVPQVPSNGSPHTQLKRQVSVPVTDSTNSKRRIVRLRSLGSLTSTSASDPDTPEANSPDLLDRITEETRPEPIDLRHQTSEVSMDIASPFQKTVTETFVFSQLEEGGVPRGQSRCIEPEVQIKPDLQVPRRAISERLLDELERLHTAHEVFDALPRRTSVIESL